ncbi:sensor histidine kinase [Streptomyces antibioticus]|uniref:sensor histidine kinase n=1 Tax=Streptomyces antibioticus TaxID=1890 RepID=UPI00224DBD0A|nr:nitrate- and nitrite sensing domain-containing protein [Streptomyces antibioticus]MCX4740388.1 nitrate- and nitrite sensing domain-containing protein [Streptomyces antibioticus]
MRWPVGRPTTVRTRIVALALAPVVALMALWTFAMVSVTAELRALIRLQGVYEDFGTPVDTAVGQIQIERRLSAAYLGASHDTDAAGELLAQQRRTDRAVSAMRDAIQDGDRSRLTGTQRESLETMLRASDGLDPLRDRVLSRKLTWDRAVTEYGAIVEPGFDAESALTALQAGQLARESQVVIELVRVREFVSREDALVAGARAAGTLTDRQYDTLTATIEDRRVFEHTYVPDLPADSRALFESFQRGELHRSLVEGEDALLRAGPARAGKAVAADTWRTTTDRAVKRYMELCTQSAENSAARGRDFAYGELTKAAVAGFVGLAAVGLSLWFSVRGARRISRRLETLRDDADLLATRQLPDVMRRLSAGDDVDAVAEAPPLAAEEGDADEIDQVGRSFNSARLAAVEAAVTQATLRRGLFAVLLNIARRNQALVHRQLKLVDTLERRTDDPEILGQLFGIDHLTTRMRRHAESLIILSGAVPGRRWRRPVPVADVVSSAVGEIEDYTRVVVPPMPEIGVAADAVADVVHLIAELLENATVFSPPHTQVTVRTGRVSGGFVVEIDDRGLGLDPDQLADAQRTLTDPDAFDPTRHDRLGLYVVGRLAARHDIQVTLRDSPYGGTTAVVLLPSTVLAPVTPPGAAPAAPTDDATPEDARTPGRAVPEARTPDTARPANGTGEAHETARSLTDRVPAPEDARTSGRAVPEARTPDIARPANGTGEAHDTARPLTDRVPAPEDARTPGRAVPEARTPDTARPAHRTGEAHETARPLSDRVPEHHVAGAPGAAEPPAGHDRAPGPLTHGVREGAPSSGHEGGRGPVGSAGTAPAGTEGSGGAPAPAGPPASGLPRRVRQASLAAPLRDEPPARDATPEREVDAEEMRAVFGSFQRGLERGRQGLPTRRDGDEGTEADHAQ